MKWLGIGESSMKWIGILLAVVAVVVLIYKVTFPTYSYRYRLQISLSVDDKIYAGSSVVEVVWQCGPKITGLGRCAPSLGGQAALIDLGPRGVVVAALRSGETFSADKSIDAVALCANAFGYQSSDAELPELSRLTGRRNLSSSNLPRLVWFANPADMKSAQKIANQDVASVFGPSARIMEAFVEITKDPIVVDIAKQLPWFPALLLAQKRDGIVSEPRQFQLIYNMFVGENS